MTLNLTIVNYSGAWQSADHRITDLKDGRKLDDESMKIVISRCRDGSFLLAYAGIGTMDIRGDIITLSEWLREIMRGKLRTVDESMTFISDAATQDIGQPLTQHRHLFSVAPFMQTRPWAFQTRNFSVFADGTG